MAQVWLAEHRINKRKAAIKILKPTAMVDADAEELFQREGEVLAGFREENIVSIYDINRIDDLAYIVMEYLPGGTLLERINNAPIQLGEAIGLTIQIARALGAAHGKQIIHRDLKPANVMLRDEVTPVLTDFGAVRMLDRATIYGRQGVVIGTPSYMSPEQISNESLDGRSDLYALGVLYFQLITGDLPFYSADYHEVLTMHLSKSPPRLPNRIAMLQPIIDRLLAKSPNDRFASSQSFIVALQQCFAGEPALRRLIDIPALSLPWRTRLNQLEFQIDCSPALKKQEAIQSQPPTVAKTAGKLPATSAAVVAHEAEAAERWVPLPAPESSRQVSSKWTGKWKWLIATVIVSTASLFAWWYEHDTTRVASPIAPLPTRRAINSPETTRPSRDSIVARSERPLTNKVVPSVSPTKLDPSFPGERFTVFGENTIKDAISGIRWTRQDNGADVTWADAKAHCASRAGRLPSVLELQGIYEKSLNGTCGDSICGVSPLFELTGLKFWASDPNGPMDGWHVTLYYGFRTSYPLNQSDGIRALCVIIE